MGVVIGLLVLVCKVDELELRSAESNSNDDFWDRLLIQIRVLNGSYVSLLHLPF